MTALHARFMSKHTNVVCWTRVVATIPWGIIAQLLEPSSLPARLLPCGSLQCVLTSGRQDPVDKQQIPSACRDVLLKVVSSAQGVSG
jgi:hypothetical protein